MKIITLFITCWLIGAVIAQLAIIMDINIYVALIVSGISGFIVGYNWDKLWNKVFNIKEKN